MTYTSGLMKGRVYIGNFVNDERHGQGISRWPWPNNAEYVIFRGLLLCNIYSILYTLYCCCHIPYLVVH